MKELQKECKVCPRECGVDRIQGNYGYCGKSSNIMVARAALHLWEEPCITGKKGSGTIFFSGCPLHCIFCQNYEISRGKKGQEESYGKEVSIFGLKEIMLKLQEKEASNINLVTGTHYIPQIAKALTMAKKEGLTIPVVFNTGGYEKVESLKLLEGLVDIYLPDLKYFSPKLSKEYCNAEDYFEVTKEAIEEMVRQVGSPVFDIENKMKRGVMVRHMILPGSTKDSMKIMEYLLQNYGNKIYISLMNQYTPMKQVGNHPLLKRKVTAREYKKVIDYALSLGWEHGFIQDKETAKESFIPLWNGEGVE